MTTSALKYPDLYRQVKWSQEFVDWLEEFYINEVWFKWPTNFGDKGSKKDGLKALIQEVKNQGQVEVGKAHVETIAGHLIALKKWDDKRQKKGEFVKRWKSVAAWLRAGDYDREIECESDRQQQAAQTLCQCGKPTVVQSKCVDCYDKGNPDAQASTQRLRESWLRVKAKIPMLEGESNPQYARRAYKLLGGV